jgi:hypothetical protein
MKTLDFPLPDDVDALKELVRAMAEKPAVGKGRTTHGHTSLR